MHRFLRVAAYGALTFPLFVCLAPTGIAQEEGEYEKPVADIAVQEVMEDRPKESLEDEVNTANNPLADLVAISLHNYFLDRGWPSRFVRFFHYRNPALLAVFVILDWLRARLGYATSNQRVIARKPGAPSSERRR